MMLSRGESRTILTDRSKFDRIALIKVCEFEEFDRLVTDAPPPSALANRLAEAGVTVDVAQDCK
jgi:DeoR family glycerol-3-phosphate regulon repressor